MPVKCVYAGGCPVKGCDEDGECYLWRCKHPHAPMPDKDEEFLKFIMDVLAQAARRTA